MSRRTPSRGSSLVEPAPESPYDKLSYSQLQAECKERGLRAKGKRELLSRSLSDFDLVNSPVKTENTTTPSRGRPKPTLSSLKTEAYPESDSDGAETSEDEVEPSPSGSPVRTQSTSKKLSFSPKSSPSRISSSPKPPPSPLQIAEQVITETVPGWMLQAAFFSVILLIVYVLSTGGSAPATPQAVSFPLSQDVLSSLRQELGSNESADKIIQTLRVHPGGKALVLYLVGPTSKTLPIARKVASLVHPHVGSNPLVLKDGGDESVLMGKIIEKLTKTPESTIIIDTDPITRENSAFLGILLDDTMPSFTYKQRKEPVRSDGAVFILLGDLAKGDSVVVDHDFAERELRNRLPGRVAQRVRGVVVV